MTASAPGSYITSFPAETRALATSERDLRGNPSAMMASKLWTQDLWPSNQSAAPRVESLSAFGSLHITGGRKGPPPFAQGRCPVSNDLGAPSNAVEEKHYRVRELAQAWSLSRNTIISYFADEPGVLKLEANSGKRRYTVLRIPASVALRVHDRLSHKSLQPAFAARGPLRVIRLRDLHRAVPQKPRDILKLHAV